MVAYANNHRPRVICPVCKKEVAGSLPKGGDGTELRPRKHLDQRPGAPKKTVCEGSSGITTNIVEI